MPVEKVCGHCGASFTCKPSRAERTKYCSKACMDAAGAQRTLKVCEHCGKEFHSYAKSRRFCSTRCSGYSLANLQKLKRIAHSPKTRRESKGRLLHCKGCGSEFRYKWKKLYCPACVSNGVSKLRHRRNKGKRDLNQDVIVRTLQEVGATVLDLADQGNGCPDIVVGWHGENILMEIKNPDNSYGRRGLNKNQTEWAELWRGGKVYVVRTPEEALEVLGFTVYG